MREDIASLRNEYTQAELDEASIVGNPFEQFEKWFSEAKSSEILEPNAMIISTVSAEGVPSSRTVLLKDMDQSGFTFYTNYDSKKAAELKTNANISLLFPWFELERQVIITGKAEKVSREQSETYFRSRPRGSQIGAHVSNQSSKIERRQILESKMAEVEKQYKDQEVPLPDNWGGYRVIPTSIEFWQGRRSRLHDRILFELNEDQSWSISRLAP